MAMIESDWNLLILSGSKTDGVGDGGGAEVRSCDVDEESVGRNDAEAGLDCDSGARSEDS